MLAEQETLTPREQEVFDLMLKGIPPKQITFDLNITSHTFDTHRTKLYRKLKVKNIKEFNLKYRSADNYLSLLERKEVNSLASQETPLIISPYKNEPWGWHHYLTFPMFIYKKITANDKYTFSCTFTSNVDFDSFLVGLAEHTIGENGYGHIILFNPYIVLSEIKANIEYSFSAIMIPKKSSNGTDPSANRFVLDVLPNKINQPILTFTQFELVRNG
ncbi:MAG: LuxR C-terminal-related transcriptional regulator [Treponema sp.]|nr:LuxR C-terminal-related transcriptional regulator [Treponema sp.]